MKVISIFYNKLPTYNPQFTKGKPSKRVIVSNIKQNNLWKNWIKIGYVHINLGIRNPKTVLEFSNPEITTHYIATEKVPILEYLIKTYTNEGDTVLDCYYKFRALQV
jgi:site-specific DNA-methyltransferase (adenine-specific)